MNNANDSHSRTTESAMRNAYDTVYRLRQESLDATSSKEYRALRAKAERVDRRWRSRSDRWSAEWAFLDQAVQGWAERPAEMRRTRYNTLRKVVSGASALDEVRVEVASLLQADRLTGRGQRSLNNRRATVAALAYLVSYRELRCPNESRATVTSWWQAREWLFAWAAEAADGEQDTEAEIIAVDYVSGHDYPLLTADGLTHDELRTELVRLGELFGDIHRDGQRFSTEPRYDHLTAAYVEAFAAANHPDAGEHRLEYRLRADDLRDQALAVATYLGTPSADHLAALDCEYTQRTKPLPSPSWSWLDRCVKQAEHARETLYSEAFTIRYGLTAGRGLQLGWSPVQRESRWQAYEIHLSRGNDLQTVIGCYRSLGDLLYAVHEWGNEQGLPHEVRVHPYALERLRAWDDYVTSFEYRVAAGALLREAIRTGKPYELLPAETLASPWAMEERAEFLRSFHEDAA
ncbi:hypothetical protein DFR70_12754 [Nocardia tenerifensis]|uniref:Uncharacterized protein n=1 Tax=Nocardia tenerifensis TaxID=228006 RepID=A0A318JKW1_9NOCA|nr:hypothetical protein [Nocardia tenerifensis]PXX53443.1 hypothetical protein DFR70_12754 [Nocardia tenerifensis]